jgi:hypothetical protein
MGKSFVYIGITLLVSASIVDARPKKKAAAARPKAEPKAKTRDSSAVRAAPTEPISVPTQKSSAAPVKSGARAATAERESRIEFDERLVQGQTASGAIYLFQRGESEFLSMVRVPSTFRERTMQKVYASGPQQKPSKGR